MLRVVILGYGTMFTNLIAGALDANCEIVGVLRYEHIKYPPLLRKIKDIFCPSIEYNYIKSYRLPEIEVRSVNTELFKKKLLKLNPDIILVGSWGEKIKKEIYDIPKIASINTHPSLLPKYRGPNPYFWVIKNREDISGVTFHLIDSGYDTGAILAQEEVKIYPSDTGKSLKDRTVLTARGVVCDLLKALREDIIIPLQQREDKASYYSHPKNLELDFSETAENNHALIRAIYPWSEAYFRHKNCYIAVSPEGLSISENVTEYIEHGTITKIDYKNCKISVLCADNKILTMQIKLYSKWDRPFTRNYIKQELVPGTVISKQD